MKKPAYEETPIKEVIEEYTKALLKNTGEKPVIIEWKEIVGPLLFGHVFLEKIDKKRLYIKCEHPSYASVVKMNEKQIMKKCKELFPDIEIKGISIY